MPENNLLIRYEPYLRRAVQGFVKSLDEQGQKSYAEDERGGDKEFFCPFYGMPNKRKVRELTTDNKIRQLILFSV